MDCHSNDSHDSEESFIFETPPEMREMVKEAQADFLPTISKNKYNNTYITFKKWADSKKVKGITENIILVYLMELSAKLKPPTQWSTYSMLKCTIKNNDNVDIGTFLKVTTFLKRKSDGYKPKKSKTFSSENINQYLSEAPDVMYLATKVALIIGISGACRREELANIKIQDVKPEGNLLLIEIPNTKTKKSRSFTVDGEFKEIILKYKNLRPKDVNTNKFFLNFQKGKCTSQVIGKNKFGTMPSQIAAYLHLESPELYTGHCFRRTSATLLANSGADITTLKRHGGWKTSTVAEGYIDDSINYKRQIGNQIELAVNLQTSGLNSCQENPQNVQKIKTPNTKRKLIEEITSNVNSIESTVSESTNNISAKIQKTADATFSSHIRNSQESNQSITYNITNCTFNIYK